MGPSKSLLTSWFAYGVEHNYDYMIIVCDTYDYEDYPVYTTKEDFHLKYPEYNYTNMQKVMEVYDLKLNKDLQINSASRVFNIPNILDLN